MKCLGSLEVSSLSIGKIHSGSATDELYMRYMLINELKELQIDRRCVTRENMLQFIVRTLKPKGWSTFRASNGMVAKFFKEVHELATKCKPKKSPSLTS